MVRTRHGLGFLAACVAAAGCSGGSGGGTTVEVTVSNGAMVAPAAIVLTVYDHHGVLVARRRFPDPGARLPLPLVATSTVMTMDGYARAVATGLSTQGKVVANGWTEGPVAQGKKNSLAITLDGPATDIDTDGVLDAADNCPAAANPDQTDANGDGVGDACANAPDAGYDAVDGGDACVSCDDGGDSGSDVRDSREDGGDTSDAADTAEAGPDKLEGVDMGGGTDGPDAGADTSGDKADVGEAGSEASPEKTDAPAEAVDAAADGGDAPTDVPVDAPADAPADTPADAGSEAGPDSSADASPDAPGDSLPHDGPITPLFADDFELGNLSRWAGVTGDLSADMLASLAGSYGLSIAPTTSGMPKASYGYTTVASGNRHLIASFKIRVKDYSLVTEGATLDVLRFRADGVAARTVAITLIQTSGNLWARLDVENGGVLQSGTAVDLGDAIHTLKLEWLGSTGGSGSDGAAIFTVDGSIRTLRLGLVTGTAFVKRVELGATHAPTASTGTFDLDNFQLDNGG